ncbi:DMT family transporter [Ornithinimicrobium avium]|uniref:DUF308 domain-containing protein n=1 Tax=Ornithinimicrobium avium TaxID=2283195 RepID=A0A345NKN0_9MICO|nr:hypothetical protein [Ornithinimicrobium avium]AXH95588.1 hypothetical protein DV701_05145 [Ornithinimicrobium avium]
MSEPDRQDHGGGGDREELDRRFREIVAGLDQELRPGRAAQDAPPRDPSAGDQPSAGDPPPRRPLLPAPPPLPDPPPLPPSTRHLGPGTPEGMATDHRSYEPPEEDDHFVPPRPDPLPAGDLHFWAILVGLVVGPLLIFLSAVLPVLPSGWTGVGAVLTLVGFVLLVLRQPRRRRHDGDWGARV